MAASDSVAPHYVVPRVKTTPSTLEQSFAFGSSALKDASSTTEHKFYLYGHPISHSLAPLLHNTLFSKLGLPWNYSLHDSLDIDSFLPLLRADNCIGSAVTMPHKVTFMSCVDDVTEEGRIIGAANTIFVRLDENGKKRYIGTNTDCIGIRESFAQNIPGSLEDGHGKPGMVLGGGGACRSAVYALWKWGGASKIYLVNRVASEVDAIIASFRSHKEFTCELIHLATIEEAEKAERPVLIVGTVPDFPPKEPGEILARQITQILLDKRGVDNGRGYVLEMCYHPKIVTELYQICERAGWEVIPGTEAMIHQGVAQQVLWTEKPLEDFKEALEAGNYVVHTKLKETGH